jgi:hypothetical protein
VIYARRAAKASQSRVGKIALPLTSSHEVIERSDSELARREVKGLWPGTARTVAAER